jgi:biotin carboxyl carrier protein
MEDGESKGNLSRLEAMVKLKLVLDGRSYEIEMKSRSLLVDNKELPWSVHGDSVTVAGNAHTVSVSGDTATVDGITYPVQVQWSEDSNPSRQTRTKAEATGFQESGAITALMPGLIVKVLKKEGEQVQAGDTVFILEAMKMQNELRAEKSGSIKKINVKEGQSVEMREVLAIIG